MMHLKFFNEVVKLLKKKKGKIFYLIVGVRL